MNFNLMLCCIWIDETILRRNEWSNRWKRYCIQDPCGCGGPAATTDLPIHGNSSNSTQRLLNPINENTLLGSLTVTSDTFSAWVLFIKTYINLYNTPSEHWRRFTILNHVPVFCAVNHLGSATFLSAVDFFFPTSHSFFFWLVSFLHN